MAASRRRNEAETEVPMMPPTREKVLNLVEMAEAVPATAMEIIITMLLSVFLGRRMESQVGVISE